MSRVSNPAGSWLAGAQTGLQLRAQDIGVDQYDQRLAQDQSQHEDNLALASKRYGLDAEWNAFRIAEAEREFERAKTRGRFSLDLARSHLPQRGGLPMMTPKGPFFTPPGQADRLHSFLDYAADDPELAKAVSELVMSGAEKVQEFETWREAAKKSGADRFIPKDSPVWGMINAWDQSLTPKTLDVAMEQADQQIEQGLALELGEKAGIPKEQIALMTPAQVQAEASRRLSEQRRNEQDTKETAAKADAEAAALEQDAQDLAQKFGMTIEDARVEARLRKRNQINERSDQTGRENVTKAMIEADPEYRMAARGLTKAEKRLDTVSKLAVSPDDKDLLAAQKAYEDAIDAQEAAYEKVHSKLSKKGEKASAAPSPAAAPASSPAPTNPTATANPQTPDDWARAAITALGKGRSKDEYKAWIRQNSGK